jgi:dipeptidyl aminopeptidase/acylaminoacyl peptidase
MRRVLVTWLTAAIASAAAQTATAQTIEKSGGFGGMTVHYKVVLPPAYDPAKSYPTILTFPGGPQTMQVVDSRLDANWRGEAEKRGYIVISPAAPDKGLFFEGGAAAFPAFIEQILRDYHVQGGKMAITGASNGGLSAFHIAARYPKYFTTVIGYPGMLWDSAPANMEALKPLCVYMHVGGEDTGWRDDMRAQADQLKKHGVAVHFAVEPNEGHMIRALSGAGATRLYDEIENGLRGCK